MFSSALCVKNEITEYYTSPVNDIRMSEVSEPRTVSDF